LISKNLKNINICRTIIFPVVLYGCETWPLTLREERRLKVSDNRVQRRIFGRRRNEVTGEWRKLYNGEINDLYSTPNIVRVIKSRKMRLAGHVVRMGNRRGVFSILAGKPEAKRPLERPGRRLEDNFKWIFRKWDVGAWTGSTLLKIGISGSHL
jgi:hypothetical protein